jgi:Acetyltransferases
MKIEFATENDLNEISRLDEHISRAELASLIPMKRVIVARDNNELCAWLRYGLFWDNIPFMNMIFVLEDYQGKGLGKRLVEFWEAEVKSLGFHKIMTSTLSNEQAQHFYRKLGYKDCGSLLLPGEALEILFLKEL